MLGRLLLFIGVFAGLQLSWQALQGSRVQHLVVDELTVGAAVALVNTLTPGVQAQSRGSVVSAPGGGLNIVNGCDGTEVWFLLAAAFAVAPLSPRARLLGFVSGTAVVFAVNQLRILALFYACRGHPGLFELLHGSVGPVLVVLAVAGYFHVWLVHHAARVPAAD